MDYDESILFYSSSLETELLAGYPKELYEWDDFIEHFPNMLGNLSMHPILWRIYIDEHEKRTEHN
tara:strand:- start:1801 stop:1995 length:195 start_codon:yes stop_codon:yes gene_type:complete